MLKETRVLCIWFASPHLWRLQRQRFLTKGALL
jgi:hypothetical protein